VGRVLVLNTPPARICHSVDLPLPEGPTMTMPMRCVHAMCSCSTFSQGLMDSARHVIGCHLIQ